MLWNIVKFGLPVLCLLGAASYLTTKTFRAETVIPAPPEEVWAVLMATESYPDWNPTVVEVVGRYETGATVTNMVKDSGGKILEIRNTVRALESNRELRQTGGIPGIMSFDHRWLLEPAAGGTRVTQLEIDRGAFLWFWNSDWVEPAYASTNEALARRVAETSR